MADFNTRIVDELMTADADSVTQQRNTRVQKYCDFCGGAFLGDKDTEERFCKDCGEDN